MWEGGMEDVCMVFEGILEELEFFVEGGGLLILVGFFLEYRELFVLE